MTVGLLGLVQDDAEQCHGLAGCLEGTWYRLMNSQNHPALEKLIETFVLPERRDRLRGFFYSKKRYGDFLDELLHDARHIDPSVIVRLPDNQRDYESVIKRLSEMGVRGDAYLVGTCGQFADGMITDVRQLLAACVGSMTDSLVYSPSANVAYYEGHEGFGYIYTTASKTSRTQQ